jgi:hypothetical protein
MGFTPSFILLYYSGGGSLKAFYKVNEQAVYFKKKHVGGILTDKTRCSRHSK